MKIPAVRSGITGMTLFIIAAMFSNAAFAQNPTGTLRIWVYEDTTATYEQFAPWCNPGANPTTCLPQENVTICIGDSATCDETDASGQAVFPGLVQQTFRMCEHEADIKVVSGSVGAPMFDDSCIDAVLDQADIGRAMYVAPAEADLEVTVVEDSPDPVVIGDGGSDYTFTITNNGPADATGIEATMSFATTGGTLYSASPCIRTVSQGTEPTGNNSWVWTVGSLPSGETATIREQCFSASNSTDDVNREVTLTITAADQPDPGPGANSASVDTTYIRQVDITVTKTESIDPVVAGSGAGNLVYWVYATNNGPSDVTGLALADLITMPDVGVSIDQVNGWKAGGYLTGSDNLVEGYYVRDPGSLGVGDWIALEVIMTVALDAPEGTDIISDEGFLCDVICDGPPSLGGEDIINTDDDVATEATSIRWPTATYRVTKLYEGNAGPEVDVTLECLDPAGLLVYDPQTVTTQGSVVVRRFSDDATCSVVEEVPDGYYEVARTAGCDADPVDQGSFLCDITNATTVTRVQVIKTFSDGNETPVDITLTCDTGLPLEQTLSVEPGQPGVTFVVTDYIEGTMGCEVTESGSPVGYKVDYIGDNNCVFEQMASGLIYECEVHNEALPGTFTVWKDWVVPNDGGDYVIEKAHVTITCDSPILEDDSVAEAPDHPLDSGSYQLSGHLGDGESLVATVETLQGPATCSATEQVLQSGVEMQDDCGPREIPAGGSSECTFTNTVFFEGIPTLSQYGLAIMALLMLGVGFIGFRRFV